MLRFSTIKGRLTAISLVTTGIALLLASLVFAVYETISFRRALVESLKVQAAMIGSNSTVALTFDNRKDAEEVLGALEASPNIVHAAIFARDGRAFAVYHRTGGKEDIPASAGLQDGHAFAADHVSLVSPILLDGVRIGRIYIRSDLRNYYRTLAWYAGITAIAVSGSLLIAFLLVSRLQRSITRPILDLARLMTAVSEKKDYSVRSATDRHDETGRLANGFNEMLSQIQRRDRELEQYQGHLEEMVAARTAELAHTTERLQQELAERKRTEDQLRHSQKMEAVGQLSGGVAHDFNNILTAIIGYGSLIEMNMPPNDPQRHYVEEILSSAERAAALTQSLLAFSRKQVFNLKPVDVPEAIEHVSKLLQRLIGEDISLVRTYAHGSVVALADRGQLEQVLMNLATNARDAMPNGGQLTIEAGQVVVDDRILKEHDYMTPGAYAQIVVSDTGVGMDQQTRSRIFEPFFTTKEVGRGTGLGLSIVYGIIKQHNGYITVDSEPGSGTTFTIYLPLTRATQEASAPVPKEEVRGGSETVLIAEDSDQVRRLTRSVLEQAGYTVIEAVDGEDAIEKFRQHRERIQLLLLDIIMPKMNGKEVYDEAKQMVPGIRVLFMSGYTADIMRDRGVLDDRQEFLSKPVLPTKLLKRVREILDSRKA